MRKHTIINGAIIITVIYAGTLGWLHWGNSADATIATYIDANKLNSLGDFLAGIFSPLAFLWLIATVLLQSNELALQRKETADNREVMREQAASLADQHKLAMATAKANYKFALFDKRIGVYDEFNDLSMIVNTTGTFDHSSHGRFIRAGHAARNIFSDDPAILDWVQKIQSLGAKSVRLAGRIEFLEGQQGGAQFGMNEQIKLEGFREDLALVNQELAEAYDWNAMDQLFLPYLRLPVDIRINEVD